MGSVVDDWVRRETIAAHSGIRILRQALREAASGARRGWAGAKRFRVTLLKPDAILTDHATWSRR